MSAKLLYLSNGPTRISVARLDQRFAALGFEVDVRWAYEGEFPDDLSPYAGCDNEFWPTCADEFWPTPGQTTGPLRRHAAGA
jgi:hypothetical protein